MPSAVWNEFYFVFFLLNIWAYGFSLVQIVWAFLGSLVNFGMLQTSTFQFDEPSVDDLGF